MRKEIDSDQWYTPEYILERVVKLMGPYYDPCTSLKVIDATRFDLQPDMWLDEHEDFLDPKAWKGIPQGSSVFMNPPYSKEVGTTKPFAETFVNLWREGIIKEGLILTNSNTSVGWWQDLAMEADAVLFHKSRIKFDSLEDGRRVSGTQPRYANSLFWFGELPADPRVGDFYACFGDLGTIMELCAYQWGPQ